MNHKPFVIGALVLLPFVLIGLPVWVPLLVVLMPTILFLGFCALIFFFIAIATAITS